MAQLVGYPLPPLHWKSTVKINVTSLLVGDLLKGSVDDAGKLKDAALMVGIKLDLEAEVHVTARIRGDILVRLY
jgi:hypothetical protein